MTAVIMQQTSVKHEDEKSRIQRLHNYSVTNMQLQEGSDVFTTWKFNQHLHHLPKNTKASTQGASNYLTMGIFDLCTHSEHQLEKLLHAMKISKSDTILGEREKEKERSGKNRQAEKQKSLLAIIKKACDIWPSGSSSPHCVLLVSGLHIEIHR